MINNEITILEYQIIKTTDLDMMYGGNCYYFVTPQLYSSVNEEQVLQYGHLMI